MGARDEPHGKWTDLLHLVRLYDDGLVLQAVESHQAGHGCSAVHRAAVAPSDDGNVEGVVEARVSDQYGVGRWHPPRQRLAGRMHHTPSEQVPQTQACHVRIDQHCDSLIAQHEAGGS